MEATTASTTELASSPSAYEIPPDIAEEFQKMSDDADAILQSIRHDEETQSKKKQPKAKTPPRQGGDASQKTMNPMMELPNDDSYDEDDDDDMTDDLIHLE